MTLEIRIRDARDIDVLGHVAPGVFGRSVQESWAREFLSDRRHHLAVAIEDGVVVGMVSAQEFLHPDKPPQLWIMQVGVAPSHQRRGIGRRLLERMLAHGTTIGCDAAWLTADVDNAAADALYRSVGGVPEQCALYAFVLPEAVHA